LRGTGLPPSRNPFLKSQINNISFRHSILQQLTLALGIQYYNNGNIIFCITRHYHRVKIYIFTLWHYLYLFPFIPSQSFYTAALQIHKSTCTENTLYAGALQIHKSTCTENTLYAAALQIHKSTCT
jgi:hypothetical protein